VINTAAGAVTGAATGVMTGVITGAATDAVTADISSVFRQHYLLIFSTATPKNSAYERCIFMQKPKNLYVGTIFLPCVSRIFTEKAVRYQVSIRA
jgi:hypothetical protein